MYSALNVQQDPSLCEIFKLMCLRNSPEKRKVEALYIFSFARMNYSICYILNIQDIKVYSICGYIEKNISSSLLLNLFSLD